jgi:hypothetical protein
MAEPWNSLEVAKLAVGLATPLAVAGLGWFVSRKERVNYAWDDAWEATLFADPERAPPASDEDVRAAYHRVMHALTRSLGAAR